MNLNRILSITLILTSTATVHAQTTLFSDSFNRAALTTGAPTNYSTTVTAGDGGASLIGSQFLRLTNDSGAKTNASGRVFVTGETASFTLFSQQLASNAAALTWSFNAKSNRTSDPGGFGAGTYGMAVVLGATSSDLTTANGYAITYGNPGSPDPIRLVRFTGGLDADANLTTLISRGAADLAGFSNFFSVKATYTPSDESWRLYVRDDGSSAWGEASAVSAQIGSAVSDSTYTHTPLTHFGFLWNYNSAANQSVQFDNYQLTTQSPMGAGASAPEPATLLLFLPGLVALRRRRK